MRYILIGRGKMGRLLQETARAAGDQVEAAFGREDLDQLGRLGKVADVVIDFSRPEALPEICSYVRRTGTALLSGTTGYTSDQLRELQALGSAAPVLWSANFSLGVAVLARALRDVTGVLRPEFDIEDRRAQRNRKALGGGYGPASGADAGLWASRSDRSAEQGGDRHSRPAGRHSGGNPHCAFLRPRRGTGIYSPCGQPSDFCERRLACGPAVARESKRHL